MAAYAFDMNKAFVFCNCLIGMIPLVMHLSRAAEDITIRTDDAVGALVNVTCGIAVEIVLSLAALRANRISLIQNILAGSMLSNLLFGEDSVPLPICHCAPGAHSTNFRFLVSQCLFIGLQFWGQHSYGAVSSTWSKLCLRV